MLSDPDHTIMNAYEPLIIPEGSDRLVVSLCYLIGWAAALPAFLLMRKNRPMAFHTLQMLIIEICLLVCAGMLGLSALILQSIGVLFTILMPFTGFLFVFSFLLCAAIAGGLILALESIRLIMVIQYARGVSIQITWLGEVVHRLMGERPYDRNNA